MGMDAVELILAAEDRFGVSLPDEEVSKVCTVGGLFELIAAKVGLDQSDRCMTAMAFYRLRRAIVSVLGFKRSQIQPASPLSDVLPLEDRRRRWPDLAEAMGLRLPRLGVSRKVALLLVSPIFVVFVSGFVVLYALGLDPSWSGLLVFVLAAYIILAISLARPLAVHVDHAGGPCETVGDLARIVGDCNFSVLSREAGTASRADLWHSVASLVAEELGVRLQEITPGTRFVEDLNCG